MQPLPYTRSCFVCGESNPIGLRLKFETDGRIVRTCFVPKPEHVGFKQTIHGGLLATLLDEIMAWACIAQTKRFGYCAELNVRFVQTARPGEAITATAELVNNARNKLFETRGELRNSQNAVLATATGKYLAIKTPTVTDMMADLIGNVEAIAGQTGAAANAV
ncbi:MAG: PaaI family thioesterase [Verrucomicrobia bacterium]|nr:PaaI family thioesterase [Verrucomicrobiota bacterium]